MPLKTSAKKGVIIRRIGQRIADSGLLTNTTVNGV
jgi:hypothetical protein